jgi:hypothetical protein
MFIFLNTFQAGFPVKYKTMIDENNWITQGIKISCKHRSSLYALTKNSDDPKVTALYMKCCDILRKVIKEAKQRHYSTLIAKSNNRRNSLWNIQGRRHGKYIKWNRFHIACKWWESKGIQ